MHSIVSVATRSNFKLLGQKLKFSKTTHSYSCMYTWRYKWKFEQGGVPCLNSLVMSLQYLESPLLQSEVRGSPSHNEVPSSPVLPGEVEQGDWEVEDLSIGSTSEVHVVLSVEPLQIQLCSEERLH